MYLYFTGEEDYYDDQYYEDDEYYDEEEGDETPKDAKKTTFDLLAIQKQKQEAAQKQQEQRAKEKQQQKQQLQQQQKAKDSKVEFVSANEIEVCIGGKGCIYFIINLKTFFYF